MSDRAWEVIEATETDSFYADLTPWRTAIDEGWFPYTHLTANLQSLDAAIDLLLDEGLDAVYERHEAAAARCRERARDLGLSIVPGSDDLASPTVTALHVEGRASDLQQRIADEEGVILATGLGEHADDVLRVGHMGHNARTDRVDRAMDAIEAVLDD